MRSRPGQSLMTLAAVAAAILLGATQLPGQTATYKAARGPDGKPNLNGIWQAMNAGHWDIEAHPAAPGPLPQLGAAAARTRERALVQSQENPNVLVVPLPFERLEEGDDTLESVRAVENRFAKLFGEIPPPGFHRNARAPGQISKLPPPRVVARFVPGIDRALGE